LFIKITTKEWNFVLFVFVSLVYIHFVTTEKQRVKYENSEFSVVVKKVIFGMSVGGSVGQLVDCGGSHGDGTLLQWHH
jgi:hypothetical protein